MTTERNKVTEQAYDVDPRFQEVLQTESGATAEELIRTAAKITGLTDQLENLTDKLSIARDAMLEELDEEEIDEGKVPFNSSDEWQLRNAIQVLDRYAGTIFRDAVSLAGEAADEVLGREETSEEAEELEVQQFGDFSGFADKTQGIAP